jgi:hypothetical protein
VAANPIKYIDTMGLAKCVFTMSTGMLNCLPENETNSSVSIPVASGHNGNNVVCRNNPACTSIVNQGPIPTGCWTWTSGYTGKPNGRVLEPCAGTSTNAVEQRTQIRSHSCSGPFGPGINAPYCSQGCVTGYVTDIQSLNFLLDAEPNSTLLVLPGTSKPEMRE